MLRESPKATSPANPTFLMSLPRRNLEDLCTDYEFENKKLRTERKELRDKLRGWVKRYIQMKLPRLGLSLSREMLDQLSDAQLRRLRQLQNEQLALRLRVRSLGQQLRIQRHLADRIRAGITRVAPDSSWRTCGTGWRSRGERLSPCTKPCALPSAPSPTTSRSFDAGASGWRARMSRWGSGGPPRARRRLSTTPPTRWRCCGGRIPIISRSRHPQHRFVYRCSDTAIFAAKRANEGKLHFAKSGNERKLRRLPVWSIAPASGYKRPTLPANERLCSSLCTDPVAAATDAHAMAAKRIAPAIVSAIVLLASALGVHGVALINPEGQSYSDQMNSDLQNIKECNRTFPIGLAAMNAVLVHQRLTGVGDENFQCFLHCLYIKYGWMDEEGSFLLGTVRTSLESSELPPSAAHWLLYRCTSTSASDPCERALAFTRCFWSEAKTAPQHDEGFDFEEAFKQRFFNSRPRM